MKNVHSSDAIGEDMIRSFVQMGCAEIHAKTLVEKANAELENGLIDVENPEALQAHLEKIDRLLKQMEKYATIRRGLMVKLYEMFDKKGDETFWCQIKHLGIGSMCLFEAYQASDNDPDLYGLWIASQKVFIEALCEFLGTEITDCAACFGDMLKGYEK